jgi:hypothetical protein
MMTSKVEQIRTLNDRLRQNLGAGVETAVIATGVAALGDDAVAHSRSKSANSPRNRGDISSVDQVF